MSNPPSWEDLRPAPQEPRPISQFELLCASVFATGNGKLLLDELRRKYVDKPMSPEADERALRVSATQQHFVRELELACERVMKANAKPK